MERFSVEEYDPFARGTFSAGVCAVKLDGAARARTFPCEIWYPALSGHRKEDRRYAASLDETRDAEVCAGIYP